MINQEPFTTDKDGMALMFNSVTKVIDFLGNVTPSSF
jgi:hypothetical protein